MDIHCEIHLVHNLELREAPLVNPLVLFQVDNLMVEFWKNMELS